MGWDSTNQIMTAPLDLNPSGGDIQEATGVESGDLGYCIVNSESINKWSKYKPVRSNKMGAMTDAELKALNYGLKISVCGPHGDLSTFISGYASEWEYLRPRTGYTDKFRMFDFTNATNILSTGYRGNANSFVNANDCLFPTVYYISGSGSARFRLGINSGVNLRAGSIQPSDLYLGGDTTDTALSDMYFGLLFVYGDTRYLVTCDETLSEGDGYAAEIYISESNGALSPLVNGSIYTVYPVLSETSHATLSSFTQTDRLVALPLSPFAFKSYEPATTQTLTLSNVSAYPGLSGKLVVNFTARYDSNSAALSSISDGSFIIKHASSIGDTSGDEYESGYINPADIDVAATMAAGTTYSISINKHSSNQGYVYVKIYRGQATDVYAETWVQVSEYDPGDLEPVE